MRSIGTPLGTWVPVGLLVATWCLVSLPSTAEGQASADGYWQLERVESRKSDFPPHDCYKYDYAGGQGSATITKTLTCGKDPWSGTGTSVWSAPPNVLVPGQAAEMSLAGRASASGPGITAGFNLNAAFDAAPCGASRNRVLFGWITFTSDPGRQTAHANGKATVPGSGWPRGIPELDGRLKLNVCMDGWQAYYFYLWKPGSPPPGSPAPFTPVSPPPAPGAAVPPRAAASPAPTLEDSGARFSDLSGEIDWWTEEDPEAVHIATLETVLPVNAHVKTGPNSTAMISFMDMTTFIMKPQSEIILSSPTPRPDVQQKLLGGQLWINIKKMLKDGSMEIEASQAVATVKGTIFSVTSRSGITEAVVCEGLVTFTHRQTRESMGLGPGEKGIATSKGLRRVQVGAAVACDDYRLASVVGAPPPDAGTPAIIFDNGNGFGVDAAGASSPTVFTLKAPHRVTQVTNYHWNGGGKPPGTISLVGPSGPLGPWKAVGVSASGRPNIYWVVRPDVLLPAGTYTVFDSDQATWAQNAQSKGAGMTRVEGYPAK